MVHNSWILTTLLASLLVVVAYRFGEYQVAGDYLIYTTVTCDSTTEQCFIVDCNPADEECDQAPYKKVTLHAGSAPTCALEHSCEAFACPANDSTCEVVLCDADVIEEGEICTDIEIPANTETTEDVAEVFEVSEE